MGANAVLDIAIGLVLMYLVISLMGSVVNEYVATLLKLRGTTLQTALTALLDNPTLRADFYNHGLIDGSNKAVKGPTGDHVSYISGDTFAKALIGSLDPTKPIPGFTDIESSIKNLPDCNIRDVLLAQLTVANGNLDALRQGIAAHFDSAMDRVSGIYKRYLKWISLAVGLFIVSLLNADTIAIGSALWKDSSLRAQMVENAKSFVSGPTNNPCDTASSDSAKKAGSSADVVKKMQCLEADIRPLPVGWSAQTVPGDAWPWIVKLFGLLLSALAVSLGAPFWFDTLSKFMNVRGAGPRPPRTTS